MLQGRRLRHVLVGLQEDKDVVTLMPPRINSSCEPGWHASQTAELLRTPGKTKSKEARALALDRWGSRAMRLQERGCKHCSALEDAMLPTARPQQQSFAAGQEKSCQHKVAPKLLMLGCRAAGGLMVQCCSCKTSWQRHGRW